MRANTQLNFKTQIRDAETHEVLKDNPWRHNLVLDQGLNALAGKSSPAIAAAPAASFTSCHIGSGNNANRFPGGVITFTQVGTTLTASAPFFTSGMVGGIFKYGTNTAGAEYYITAFTSNLIVTVDTSATVAVGQPGTVWMVQQTTLQTEITASSTYQVLSGDNQSSYATPAITHKRTFVFPVQPGTITVNEIGWNTSNGIPQVSGRAVLSSSDVVGVTSYYVVIMELVITYSPSSPTAIINVGTGINTAGTVMMEFFSNQIVNSSGNAANPGSSMGSSLDFPNTSSVFTRLFLATMTQNGAIGTSSSPVFPTNLLVSNGGTWTYVAASVGKMQATCTDATTTAGETCYGLGIQGGTPTFAVAFSVKFTAPQTLPTGSFQPTIIWQMTYSRILDNT